MSQYGFSHRSQEYHKLDPGIIKQTARPHQATARIWKLPGTIAVNGDSVPELDRVHPRSTIDLQPVTPVQLGEIE